MRNRVRFPVALCVCLLLIYSSIGLTLGKTDGVSMYRGDSAHTGKMPGPGPVGEPFKLWQQESPSNYTSAIVGEGVV